jgi:hypothetical protein
MGKGNRSTVPGSIVFQLSHTVPVSAGSVEALRKCDGSRPWKAVKLLAFAELITQPHNRYKNHWAVGTGPRGPNNTVLSSIPNNCNKKMDQYELNQLQKRGQQRHTPAPPCQLNSTASGRRRTQGKASSPKPMMSVSGLSALPGARFSCFKPFFSFRNAFTGSIALLGTAIPPPASFQSSRSAIRH